MKYLGGQGWRCGESTRLPPRWLGFESRTRRHMWVEFVVGSRPCSERWTQWTKSHLVDVPLLIPIYFIIYFIYFPRRKMEQMGVLQSSRISILLNPYLTRVGASIKGRRPQI